MKKDPLASSDFPNPADPDNLLFFPRPSNQLFRKLVISLEFSRFFSCSLATLTAMLLVPIPRVILQRPPKLFTTSVDELILDSTLALAMWRWLCSSLHPWPIVDQRRSSRL
jgi:hypothetical protein